MKIIETNFKYNGKFKPNKPENIIVHHALARKCTAEDIHSWHLARGWFGFGYHYFVNKAGQVFKGRPDNANGSHCNEQSMNFKSLGICLEGCYEEYKNQTDKEVPKAQMESLIEITKYLMDKYNIPVDRVYPHRHFATYKLCPGKYFPWDAFVDALKEIPDVNAKAIQLIEKAGALLQDASVLLKKGVI